MIPTVSVTCESFDQNGNPIAGARFEAKLDRTEVYDGFVVPEKVTAFADANGVCVLELWPNALGANASSYQIKAWNPDTGKHFLDTTAVVPNSDCRLEQIIVAEPYPAVDAAQQALIAAQGALAPVTAQAQAAAASALVAQDAEDGALAAETAAQASAAAAQASEQAAATSEASASSSATTATGAAQTATAAADEAEAARDAAQAAATTSTEQATAAGESAHAAGLSANLAALSEGAAAGSESAAQGHATAAAASANTAQAQATAAQQAKIDAQAAASSAQAAAAQAEDSADAAAGQAGLAISAANNASGYASTAGTHAATATTKAGEASTSASLATAKASEAATSAAAAAADRVQTGLDAQATAADRAQVATDASTSAANAATANLKAGEAAGSAAQALAIYGSTTAVQTAVAQAAAQASLAAGYAASASSVVQQDLSGINAAALHRSPNAVTAMFVYDTSKDSDGGAWTEKCQHTSWYNETINGKWLGAQPSEFYARNEGATVGSELIANAGPFISTTGWTAYNVNASVAAVDGRLRLTKVSGSAVGAYASLPTVAGKSYKVSFAVAAVNGTTYVKAYVGTVAGQGSLWDQGNSNNTAGFFSAYFVASGTTSYITLEIAGNVGGYADFSTVSIKEVTAQTTQSGDYFQLTTDGKFYRLNAGSGITEVFRGNKRDFPRLAGIVAEAASVTIYDLTEPGRPMWMRFFSGGSGSNYNFLPSNVTSAGIAAANGLMALAFGANALIDINFGADRGRQIYSAGVLGFSPDRIASRNSLPLRTQGASQPAIANNTVNAVAMTVLPDAPVDPVTGLKVPTIWAATNGGVSRISHAGVVSNSSPIGWPDALMKLAVYGKNIIRYGVGDGSYNYLQFIPLTSPASATWQNYSPRKTGAAITSAGFGGGAVSTNLGVEISKPNTTTVNSGSSATIRSTFNTGHMVGDIRRAYLADVGAGSVTGPELVTNGTFDTDTTGWGTAAAFPGATATVVSGEMQITRTAVNGRYVQTVSGFAVGKTYRLSGLIRKISGVFNAGIGVSAVFTGVSVMQAPSVSSATATYTELVFVATQTQYAVVLGCVDGGGSEVFGFDNISVREVVADRSYKARGADINGTLTKTAVASAAQLVAYSGFSASNYLREPYSADLDFGTGEWSVGAWVNTRDSHSNVNLIANPEDASQAWNQFGSLVLNDAVAPNGTMTADKLVCPNGSGPGMVNYFAGVVSGVVTFTIRAKPAGYPRLGVRYGWDGIDYMVHATIDLETGVVVSNGTGAQITVSVPDAYGYRTCSFTGRATRGAYNFGGQISVECHPATSTAQAAYTGDGVSGIHIWGVQFNPGSTAAPYTPGRTAVYNPLPGGRVVSRSFTNGPTIDIGMDGYGKLTATAYDGTTTRTVTTTAAYNTGTWLKAEADYTTDGTLSISVNGVEVAATRGNPLLSLNNSNAVLTIGNSFNLDAPFPGSIALLKLSATVPTAEQSVWMYEQEKQMFREGAQVCLPDAGAIADLAYDEATDKWIAVSAANESEWSGLVRTSVTPVPAGSYSRVTAGGGVQMLARTTTNPGVDITIPAYGLREELVRRAEAAARLNAQLATFDYVGGFTANTTTGNTAITSVAGLTYPTSYIGARVSGAGIPANTTIVAVSGTTIYLSAAATATATGVQISFVDYVLPVGYEAKEVSLAGAAQREGATAQFTRLFDGFKETIRFGTAPSNTALVQIQAARSAA